MATIGKAYTGTELKPEADGSWIGRAATPEKGWTASFVEADVRLGRSRFRSRCRRPCAVLPDTCPYEGIDPANESSTSRSVNEGGSPQVAQ